MEEKIFLDKTNKPTDENIKTGFGKVYAYFSKINDLTKNYSKDWIFSKSSGWMLKYYDKTKALFYLIPLKNELKISLTLRESERETIMKEKSLDKSILTKIGTAKKYVEGYAIQLIISSENDFYNFKELMEIIIELRKRLLSQK